VRRIVRAVWRERRIVFPCSPGFREASVSEEHETLDREAFLAGEAARR
jgi:hypothetical protein